MSDTLQTYHLVTGTYKITGRETSLYIPADTEGTALERAAVEGIEVESILLEQPEFLRWYQFTLKELLVFMLVSGLFFGWVGKKVMEARKQKEIVEWVEGLNMQKGVVRYDYEFDVNGEYIPNTKPPGPDWLREWIGIDYFCDVEQVSFKGYWGSSGSMLPKSPPYLDFDLDLSPLYELPHLKRINFAHFRPRNNQRLRELQEALPHCKIYHYYEGFTGFGADSPAQTYVWCKQCNDWHESDSDPHTAPN